MQFDDSAVDVSGIDDRRGRGGMVALGGGGLGIVGLILTLLLGGNPFGGGTGQIATPGGVSQGTGESQQQLSARCNSSGALDRYDDCFMIKIYNEINEVWDAEFARRGADYRKPALAFFDQAARTGCGQASSEVGPFYCPPDESVFIDLGFLRQLQEQFGAQGRYAQAYILAHEVGHHLQTVLGTERKMRQAQQQDPSRRNELSVRLELQADCYAGVWGALADQRGNVAITERELDQALQAAAAVGDDRIQQRTQGRVDPESWTHGSAKQRRGWFLRGFQSRDVTRCDTFAA